MLNRKHGDDRERLLQVLNFKVQNKSVKVHKRRRFVAVARPSRKTTCKHTCWHGVSATLEIVLGGQEAKLPTGQYGKKNPSYLDILILEQLELQVKKTFVLSQSKCQ